MAKWKHLLIAALVAIPAAWALHAQTARAPALTAADYLEIQQLPARYPYAVDMHGGDGSAYAALFTEDGTFGTQAKGRAQLADLAAKTNKDRSGPGVYPTFRDKRGHQAVAGRRHRTVISGRHRCRRERQTELDSPRRNLRRCVCEDS